MTRDECIREAAKVLVAIALRVERDRIMASAPGAPASPGSGSRT